MVENNMEQDDKIIKIPKSNRRQVLIQSLLALAILGSGIIIGSAATFLTFKNRIYPHPGRGPRDAKFFSEKMSEDLGLTEEQTRKIKEIFERRAKDLQQVRKKFETQIPQERQKLFDEIEQVLTPEQMEKWKKEFKKRRHDPHSEQFRPQDSPHDRNPPPEITPLDQNKSN